MERSKMLGCVLLLTFLEFLQHSGVSGHGRLRAPPSRSTMWRYGFQSTPNYNDHELNCGGFSTHWGRNKGKCGVCGDNYQDRQPRANEGGGMYGRGMIVREYSQGEIIETEVEITANHMGFFEFSLCPHNNPFVPASEDCFRPLELADGSGTRWPLHNDVSPKRYKIAVKLPPDVTCTQCVFRWYWKSGNNWGFENGHGGLGYGPQETFIACSDIAIHSGETRVVSSSASERRPGRRPLIGRHRPATTTTTIRPTTPSVRRDGHGDSHDEDRSPSVDVEDSDESNREIAFDAGSRSSETGPCRSVGVWRTVGGLDEWCVTNCGRGYCPATHCCCNC